MADTPTPETTPAETTPATPAPVEKTAEATGPGVISKLANSKGGFLGGILEKIGLRGVIYQLGGRKAVIGGGGGFALISTILATDMSDWPKALASLAVAIVAVGLMFSISSEDKQKKS